MRVILLCLFLITFSLCAKIDSNVLSTLSSHKKANVMIEIKEKVNLEQHKKTLKTLDWIKKGRLVYKLLTEKAEKTQKTVRTLLAKKNIHYENLWIQNTILAKDVTHRDLLELTLLKSIGKITLDVGGLTNWETPEPAQPFNKSNSAGSWGIDWIKAPEAWAKGWTGKGIVLATADSGVRWDHSALINSYRGNLGSGRINHEYNFYDPVDEINFPRDRNGHGTHVQGTVTGGGSRKIGVAPDAKWMGCRIAERRFFPSNVLKCWQFLLAPHDFQGRNANPDLRPHVCSHSYTCPECKLDDAVKAHKAAGIFVISSGGNGGPRCGTATGYPSRLPEALSIGALDLRSNRIARYSARGPGPIVGTQKPAFSCPGTVITSANFRTSDKFIGMSGTSMAAPHMNGAIGLLWGAVPSLIGKFRETESIFMETSLRQTADGECGSSGSPNHVFGYGTINVLAAIEHAKKKYDQ